jgi:HPt (histidine-containing phosphotransfer) domain-containing protein
MDANPAPLNRIESRLLENDPDLRDIVEEFVAGLEGRLDELKLAYERLEWEQLTLIAHRLKGAGGSYGYPDISTLCADLERDFRKQQDSGILERFETLRQIAAAAVAGLRNS